MLFRPRNIGQRLVKRCETMTSMRGLGIDVACRAVIEVRAAQALVAHANDLL
jgi:hypothetical protein